ncbi:MAG: type I DNA topoisomerase [bacterium]
MGKSLVIVESPSKAKTINKFLGKEFKVLASVGHVRDLPKKELGVDVDRGFEPKYITIRGKGKVLAEIRSAAQRADAIYLAPDFDREGEAIAWHIAGLLENKGKEIYRVVFNEITQKAITEAFRNPGRIDQNRVDAQQARRILDRIVGYKISPLLWDKVRRGLSAGRVQSVAVRLVCDREVEIQAFKPQEYWSITAELQAKEPPVFEAKLLKISGKKAEVPNQEKAQGILDKIKGKDFRVSAIEKKQKKKNPVAPYTTSKLQMDASRKLGFSARKTMMIAQKLYEGLSVGSEGSVGLITYMRTDSTRVSEDALTEVRGLIQERFGKEYLPNAPRQYAKGKGAQDAHEAIRPTSSLRDPESIRQYLDHDGFRLYQLIWNRFVASQMNPAIMDTISVDIQVNEFTFRATGSAIRFKGFMTLYMEETETEGGSEEGDKFLPPLQEGELLQLSQIVPGQHFTQPPPRYTEATLVKDLEEKGIGRPSTYAAILSTIQDRAYTEIREKRFHPTPLGVLVNRLLVENFPDILNVEFTAKMEGELDRVEEGTSNWKELLQIFYDKFAKDLETARVNMRDVKKELEDTDIICEKCGKKMVIKWGYNGEFIACSAFPECKNTKDFLRDESGQIQIMQVEKADEKCPECKAEMVVKQGKFGRFLACTRYPECKTTRRLVQGENGKMTTAPEEKTDEICDKCGKPMAVKHGRYGKFIGCSAYPQCKNIKPLSIGVSCPAEGCGGFVVQKIFKGRTFYGCSRYPDCRFNSKQRPMNEPCPACGSPYLIERFRKEGETYHKDIGCPNKNCEYAREIEEAAPKD